MRVLCVGEMLVDIIVRPVELTTMPSIWRDWATK